MTGSDWLLRQEADKQAAQIRAGKEASSLPKLNFECVYTTRSETKRVVASLEAIEHKHYVHVESIPAVVRVTAPIPVSLVPSEPFHAFDLSPQMDFFAEEVLPCLRSIVVKYRIAAFPFMRYSIPPVSETLVGQTIVEILNAAGDTYGGYTYFFDSKSPETFRTHIPEIQHRFDEITAMRDSLQAEDQMAITYYLFHMRRWTEALVIASAVVDNLCKKLYLKKTCPPDQNESTWEQSEEAENRWKKEDTRYENFFKVVLPKCRIPKLSEIDPVLWEAFTKAKKYRGSGAHGKWPEPFDPEREKVAKKHLVAFYNVAKWLQEQRGETWELDAVDETGKPLIPFPYPPMSHF